MFDIHYCSEKIKEFVDFLNKFRNKFEDIWTKTHSVETTFKSTSINKGTGKDRKRLHISNTSSNKESRIQAAFLQNHRHF